MSTGKGKSSTNTFLDGSYRMVGKWKTMVVEGNKAVMKDPSGSSHDMSLKMGEFGDADPEIVEITGQKFYNVEVIHNVGAGHTEHVVVSEDGRRITRKDNYGVDVFDWMTEEEAAAMEEEGDPIEAPLCPYKIQPDNLGKFLWITGAPGLGKSTTAQLLSKTAGYVYYEADCFGACRNPYIPTNVPEPTLAGVYQKPLKGEGLELRREVCKRAFEAFRKMIAGGDYNKERTQELFGLMCEDIKRERNRIGGDWAVAFVALNQEVRDFVRSKLGPDLVFVVLNMEQEDVMERIRNRHKGDEGAVKTIMAINNFCEAATEDEEKTVNIMITPDMTREDVVNKILEMVN